MSAGGPEKVENRTSTATRYIGTPKDDSSKDERSLWRRFLGSFLPWARKTQEFAGQGKEMAHAFARTELAKRQNEARTMAATASKIAAEAEEKKADAMAAINAEIERIFSSTSNQTVKDLQLSVLVERFS